MLNSTFYRKIFFDYKKSGFDSAHKFLHPISLPFGIFVCLFSDKLVANLNDVLKTSNTTFKVKKFEDKFKKDMIEKWHDEFSTIWNSKELDQRLTVLIEKKQKQQQQQLQPQENDATKSAW